MNQLKELKLKRNGNWRIRVLRRKRAKNYGQIIGESAPYILRRLQISWCRSVFSHH